MILYPETSDDVANFHALSEISAACWLHLVRISFKCDVTPITCSSAMARKPA
jgi:hypothetical protein